jgi:hypothetical protein
VFHDNIDNVDELVIVVDVFNHVDEHKLGTGLLEFLRG